MLKNIQQWAIASYTILAIVVAAILYGALYPLLDIQHSSLVSDSIVSGFLFSLFTLLLLNVLKYGNLQSLQFMLRTLVYCSFAILFIVGWVGIGVLVAFIVIPEHDFVILSKAIPIRIVIGILSFSVIVLSNNHVFNYDESENGLLIPNDENELEEDAEECESDEQEQLIEHVAVKTGTKIDIIPISEIIYLQAEGDYVMIHTLKGKFLKEQTMKSFENSLPNTKFVRTHRSNIVNVEYIAQIELYDKQSQLLKLKNGAQIKISITGYKLLKKTIGL